MRIVRPVVKTVGSIGQGVRDMGRLREVASVLARHGMGMAVHGLSLPGVRSSDRYESNPQRIVSAIQELGPTFIKLGQILSTRSDVVPPEYIQAFEKLQDDVDPLDVKDIEAVLDVELMEGWREQVRTFDQTPLATASIAQVHQAVLADGKRVVLKVQRPGIGPIIRSDLHILRFLVTRAMSSFPEIRNFDPLGVLDEFERSIIAELDFHLEAKNIGRFRRLFEDYSLVRFPETVEEFSSSRVLCMEFLDGVKIRDAREAGFDMKAVGDRYLRVAYDMLFEHGFFHGDLHPGNVLVMEGGVLGVLDCGMVGTLTREMKDQIIGITFALRQGDHRTVARLFYQLAIKEERVDYGAFERDAIEVMERHWQLDSISDMNLGAFFMDIAQRAVRHQVRASPAFTMMYKGMITTEGLAKSLIHEVDPLEAIVPYVEAMIAERFSRDRLTEDLFYNATTLSHLMGRVPMSLTQLLDDLDGQRLQLTTRVVEDRSTIDAADRRQNRFILALLAITAAICGTLALSWQGFPPYGNLVVAGAFYLAAFPLFLFTLAMTLRNRG
jgi:ubiquinone biosynthesis protein